MSGRIGKAVALVQGCKIDSRPEAAPIYTMQVALGAPCPVNSGE